MPARKKDEGQPTRVAFYIRWSSHHRDAENTMEGQRAALQDHADANGQVHVATYVDEAISGRRDDRPDMNRLMRDAHQRERPFDEVLIWKFDRFGRRASTIDRRATELGDLGITLTAVRQPIQGKPAVVRFFRNLMANVAELFSDNLGEDIARGLKISSSHGVWTNSTIPFGFMKDYRMDRGKIRPFLIPDPETSWVIKNMAGLYLEGTGSRKIASNFRNEGVPGPSEAPWSSSRVISMLKNIAYAGFVHFGKKSKFDDQEILIPVPEMEIITLEEYNKIQEIMASRRPEKKHPREVASRHLLSGLTYCDRCECKMSPTGGKSSQYNCNHKRRDINPSCDTPRVNADVLDAAVLQHILDRVLIPKNTERLIDIVTKSETQTTAEVEEEFRNITLEIESLKDSRRTLVLRLEKKDENEGFKLVDFADRLSEIRDTLVKLEENALNAKAKLANEKSLTTNPKKVASYARSLDTYLRGANVDLTKKILQEIIVQVTVRPGDEEGTANVTIRYRIPSPPRGWTEATDVDELLIHKSKRSLGKPTQAGGGRTELGQPDPQGSCGGKLLSPTRRRHCIQHVRSVLEGQVTEHPTQEGEGGDVVVQEGLGGLVRIGLDEATVAVGQVEYEAVSLSLHPACDHQGPAEVALGVARRERQGHEHLSGPAAVLPHAVLDDNVSAVETELVPEPLEDVLGGVALLSGKLEILFEDAVDDPGFPTAVATAPSANPRPPGWSHR